MTTTSPTQNSQTALRKSCGGLFRSAAWFLLLGWFSALGCGSSGSPVDSADPTRQHLEKIGLAYSRATVRLNRPPKNLEELLPFVQEQGTPETILRSPNDSNDFVIVWGVELRMLKAKGDALPVVAFEKRGKDGKRHVLRGRSEVVLLSESEFQAATFPSGYTPPS